MSGYMIHEALPFRKVLSSYPASTSITALLQAIYKPEGFSKSSHCAKEAQKSRPIFLAEQAQVK